MSKVLLKFDSFEEADAIKDAMNGTAWHEAVREFYQVIKDYDKHDGTSAMHNDLAEAIKKHPEAGYDILDGFRSTMGSILDDYNLKLWE
jgi:hypothetical protein